MARRGSRAWVWLSLGALAALGGAYYLLRRGNPRLITVFGPDESGGPGRVYAQRQVNLTDSEVEGTSRRLASNYPDMDVAVFVHTQDQGFTHVYMGPVPNIEAVPLEDAVRSLDESGLTELAMPSTAALPAQAAA